jgi:hypothetical protein
MQRILPRANKHKTATVSQKQGRHGLATGSFYSFTKAMVESLLKNYPHTLTLRVRMPITSDLTSSRNFVYKIAHYEKVVNIPNSMTILDEMLPYSIEMAKRQLTGIYNFTNPGVISHNEVLDLYTKYVDPNYKYQNFTLEEQSKILAAPRSNNELDTTKLQAQFPEMLSIKESYVEHVFKPYIANGGKPIVDRSRYQLLEHSCASFMSETFFQSEIWHVPPCLLPTTAACAHHTRVRGCYRSCFCTPRLDRL